MHAPRIIRAWLFDLYASADGITLWLVDGDGVKHRCYDRFIPSFFMHVNRNGATRAAMLAANFPFRIDLDPAVQREIYSDEEWNVLRVGVHDTTRFKEVVRAMERHFPHFVFFNSDITVQQLYLYATGLFPLALGDYSIDADGRVTGWQLHDARDALEYSVPPLATMTIRNRPDFVSPKYRKTFQLEVGYDGQTYELEHQDPADVLQSLNRHLRRCDPDIIMTEYGDAVLLPMLTQLAAQKEVPLLLNRDREVDRRPGNRFH